MDDKLEIKYLSADEIRPYKNNSRTHSADQIDRLKRSIKQFGMLTPIAIHNGDIVYGHARFTALKALGWTEFPTVDVSHLSDEDKRAYIIADNRLALDAGWDLDLLKIELTGLDDEGFDLSLIGFDPDELANLMQEPTEGLTDPDAVPDIPDDPVTKPGDVWIMGKHRLCCGDSTSADDVAKALNGVEPHLMVTDPPYGVEYDAEWRKEALPDTNPGKTGGMHGKVSNDDNADWSEAWSLFPGDVAYVWHAGNKANIVADSLLKCDLNIRAQIIWNKHQHVISRGDYHPKHEPCWYAVRKNKVGHYCGGRKQSTVWDIQKPLNSETGHSTQKPVECMQRPIENNSSPGQAVYDPFLGSGTTVIAAEQTGRACHGLELSPAYCDVIVKRWQDFTGEQATLEADGTVFSPDIANAP